MPDPGTRWYLSSTTRKWLFRSLVLLCLVGFFTGTKIDYSADCILCLRRERGDDFMVFGLRVVHVHRPAQDRAEPIRDSYLLPSIPSGDPEVLDLLHDGTCEHVFKRAGFGRSPLFGGGVGCGSYSESRAFAGRRYALSALAHLYQRVPARPFARQTLAFIDFTWPADLPLSEALDPSTRGERLIDISAILNLISDEAEWQRALVFFESAGSTPAPFLHDLDFLSGKLQSPNPIIRQTSAALIAQAGPSLGQTPLAALLASSDPIVVDRAASTILAERRFELFGAMLRAQKSPPQEYWLKDYKEPEILVLLGQNDPVVDRFCFAAITAGEHLSLLDKFVERLDTRDTPEARATIAKLIRGPSPLDGESDPWEVIEPLRLPREQLKEYLDVGTASKVRDPRKGKFLNAVKGFALSAPASDWDYLRATYLREVTGGVNETYGAVMAKALMTLDAGRARRFLVEELAADDHRRQTAALAGMGLVADPGFLPAIEAFRYEFPSSSPQNPYPAAYIFKNPYYARYIDYALHRSRGIHLWRLSKTEAGLHVITKASSPR